MTTATECLNDTGRPCHDTATCDCAQGEAARAGGDMTVCHEWMSLRAAFLAQILVQRVKALALNPESAADYGSSIGVLLPTSDPALYFWRTYQLSLFPDAGETSLQRRLPRWGMWARGVLYQLPTPVPDISETGGGVWPMPVAQEGGTTPGDKKQGRKLSHIAATWATPTTQDGANNAGPSQFNRNSLPLNTQVVTWATPNAADAVGSHGGGQSRSLRTDTHQMSGSLNPEWVEALMGYPVGWTSVE